MDKRIRKFIVTVEEGGGDPGYLATRGIESRIKEALDMVQGDSYYTKVLSVEPHPDDED